MMFGFLGFGEGKIGITIKDPNVKKGSKIKGEVVLDLPKPKKANELRVEIRAERQVKRVEIKPGQTPTTTTDTEVLYSFALTLDKEREYTSKKYPFEIAVPKLNISPPAAIPGMGGAGSFMAGRIGTPSATPVIWRLKAILDVPMSMDITKSIQINVID
ncbi:MAG: hypothetical protein ABII22_02165 [Candidatus Micrarchaeota archaeon]